MCEAGLHFFAAYRWNPRQPERFFTKEESGVPRYYFHVRYEHDAADGDGVDLPDFRAALSEAVRAFGEMLQTLESSADPGLPLEMTLADEAGNPLCRLRFSAELLEPDG
jgi:hypothetical protein